MTFNPKVAGGATALAAIGGGGGYIASKSIGNDSSIEDKGPTLTSIKNSSESGTIAQTIKNAGFELLTEESSEADWKKLIDNNAETKKEELQARCKALLVKKYQPNNEYQEAIKKCTKLQTLKERAETWGFTFLNTTATSNETTNSDDTNWTTKVSSNKNAIDESSDNKDKETLKKACISASTKTHFDNDFNSIFWENYLKGCVKEETNPSETYTNSLTYSYWTKSKKITVEEKLILAGFDKQTSYTDDGTNSCTSEITQEYNEDTYKVIAVKCAKNKTFHAKAITGLSLELQEESSYEEKWNKEDRRKAMISFDSSITSDKWNESNKSKITTMCKTSSSQITKETAQEQWRNYLLACIKEDATGTTKLADSLKKDFWIEGKSQ